MAECSVFTFRNGLGQLVERLDSKLRSSPNISWRTNTAIKSIRMLKDKRKVQLETTADEPAILPDYVISTLFSKTLAALCHREDDLIIASLPSLARARAVTVMVVNLYYSTPYLAPAGFGYLIPRTIPYAQNPERALGVVFDSEYSPIASAVAPDSPAQDSVAGTKLTVMLGGHWWDDWTSYPSPEEGLQMAKDVLARHLGITEQPAASNVGLQKDCIPQYTLGHDDAMAAAHTKLLVGFCGQLRVAGNSYTGVGVNDCVRAAWDVARGLTSSNASSNTGLEYFLRKEGSELVDVPEDLL
ncbi:oxygen-dependent protoporphyrinogen oxidase [Cryomyces antarcticus]|uniref:Oxygen-dependent protoporphyrinogen oxidase n=1 Tax=Cryomyces antarcticus TaxID=329879 RepID=A0ABR0LN95_9PEZI|nr:oxygen-dependent protoporphyrinogen oxidase [Cryomyces antarcticus]KAK5014128.1 oxygen-dependent protoporphyrinogen oxidase [Cryomyces antarcticus]KAK5200968.1 oxygen-dependent protoporphyrinogen oxidase [Cryomyces antarcticus]